MLATGRPVVAVGLPELVPIAAAGLIRLAATPAEFADAIERELREDDATRRRSRREFAARNTWAARQADLADAIDTIRRRPAACRQDAAEPSAPKIHSPSRHTSSPAAREG